MCDTVAGMRLVWGLVGILGLAGCGGGDDEDGQAGSSAVGGSAGDGAPSTEEPSSGGADAGGTGGEGGGIPEAGAQCNGREGSCAGTPYGVCTNVRQGPGRCVDWSTVGASPCVGAQDCDGVFPKASFTTGEGTGQAACVTAEGVLQFGGLIAPDEPQPGFCFAFEGFIDESGEASCDPDPCGAEGFCSWLVNNRGMALVECMWPI